MKKFKRLSAALITVIMVIATIPVNAVAAAVPVKVDMTITVAGDIVAACENIKVKDTNKNGVVDIDDALSYIHKKYNKTYASEDSGYGLAITNLWGDDSGSYGYYINDQMVMTSLEAEIKDGDYVSVYSFKDPAWLSDSYAYFDQKTINGVLDANEEYEFSLTGKMICFDENWNIVICPLENAVVKTGNKTIGTTDKDGKIDIKLPAGEYVITAESDTAVIVPPVCIVNIAENEHEADISKTINLTEELALSVKASKTSKKSIKVAVKIDEETKTLIDEIEDMGFTVKYSFYKASSKKGTYKLMKTKDTAKIIPTKGVKGKTYYYKAVLKIYDDKGNFVTKTTLNQCDYGYAKWTAKTVK